MSVVVFYTSILQPHNIFETLLWGINNLSTDLRDTLLYLWVGISLKAIRHGSPSGSFWKASRSNWEGYKKNCLTLQKCNLCTVGCYNNCNSPNKLEIHLWSAIFLYFTVYLFISQLFLTVLTNPLPPCTHSIPWRHRRKHRVFWWGGQLNSLDSFFC